MIRRSVLPGTGAGGRAGARATGGGAPGRGGAAAGGGGLGARATVVSLGLRPEALDRSNWRAIRSPSESTAAASALAVAASGAGLAPRSFMRSAMSCSSGSGGLAGYRSNTSRYW